MWFRMLVGQYVRHAAQRAVMDAVSGARQQRGDRGDREGGDDSSEVESASGGADSTAQAVGEDATPMPPRRCDVVFVFALGVESGGLVDLLDDRVSSRCATFVEHVGDLDGRHVAVIESGVGRKASERATDDVIELYRPDWVVSAGFAGALCEELKLGHVIMADCVVDVHGNSLELGLKLDEETTRAMKGLHQGRLLTVDEIVRMPEQRRKLAKEHDALACDMETMAVAEVCGSRKVRLVSVRVVSDEVDDELPREVGKLMSQNSLAGKLGSATGAIWRRPGVVKDMWKLKETALKASDRLAKFLKGVLAQLPASGGEGEADADGGASERETGKRLPAP